MKKRKYDHLLPKRHKDLMIHRHDNGEWLWYLTDRGRMVCNIRYQFDSMMKKLNEK